MSDVGGPEDPEAARLREQLAAAERVAAIRAEIEAARDELAALEDTQAGVRDAERVFSRVLSKINLGKVVTRVVALALVAGIIAIIVLLMRSDGDESLRAPSRQPLATPASLSAKDPSLAISCPEPMVSTFESIEITLGASWNWDKRVGLESVDVQYGDGTRASYESNPSPVDMRKVLSHEYKQPGSYRITAELVDNNGNKVTDTCTFVWAAEEATLVVKSVTTSSITASPSLTLLDLYEFGESSERVKELQRTINSVLGTAITVDGIYGRGTRYSHLEALHRLNITTDGDVVPDIPGVSAVDEANAGTTTTPAFVYQPYGIPQAGSKNMRWNPCNGPITVKFNPGHLDPQTQKEWSKVIAEATQEISTFTGLDVQYLGTTSAVPLTSLLGAVEPSGPFDEDWPSTSRFEADYADPNILIYVGPYNDLGPDYDEGILFSPDDGQGSRRYYTEIPGSTWNQTRRFDAHFTADDLDRWYPNRYVSLLKRHVGFAFLHKPPRVTGQGVGHDHPYWYELMHGADGAGGRENPGQWGAGDELGFELVGASNGCF